MSTRRIRTILFVAVLVLGASAVARSQPLGQWHFDEDSGAVAADSVGNHPGALSGDASFVSGGVVGNAVSMSKAGDGLVEMGDVFPMTSGDGMAMAPVLAKISSPSAKVVVPEKVLPALPPRRSLPVWSVNPPGPVMA